MNAGKARQGWVPELASEEDLRLALEEAFDYRGDIRITRRDGTAVEGYLFDRQGGASLAGSWIRIIPTAGGNRQRVSYSEIAALEFTGKDTAAGKSWEAWVKKYLEKKAAGEKNIGLEPEALD
ncbi:MAG: hypothetical protein IT160_15705 [Bryobacterales bacterium]|nr:hypothetical protein [Bryobacterales bacterium]